MTKHRKSRARPNETMPAESTGFPVVAIVGRPNVGKSTLFNRLARRRLAIVHDEPGVTRDRHYVAATAFGKDFLLVDTGGFDPDDDDPMRSGIARHVKEAVAEADVVVFVTDGSTELTSADRAAVALLRRAKKPVLYAANKADSPKQDPEAFELYRHGVKEIFAVSALHGRGMGELEAAIVSALPETREPEEGDPRDLPRIAIIGRPNAGKSSLLNKLLGEDRMLVDDRPGTTRDAIDTRVSRNGKSYVFIDTAGLRKKGKVTKQGDAIEGMSAVQSVRAIERAEMVVLMCDAHEGVAEQDAKILGLAEDRGRSLIVVLNKCDLLSKEELKQAEEQARDKLTFAQFAPIVRISAKTGRGIPDLLATIEKTREAFYKRVTTGELNRFFERVLEQRTPPTQGGKAPRLYYIAQVGVAPPTFAIVSNAPDAVHFSYQRFVVNQLRKAFGFDAVPVRVHYRDKRRGTKKGAAAPSDDAPDE